MALLHTRAKLVTFRLSEEEYDYFRKACERSGRRSISDFARVAALDLARQETSARRFFTEDLGTIAVQLEDLNVMLKTLSARIERLLGGKDRQRREHNDEEFR